jgi:hypothetical protein
MKLIKEANKRINPVRIDLNQIDISLSKMEELYPDYILNVKIATSSKLVSLLGLLISIIFTINLWNDNNKFYYLSSCIVLLSLYYNIESFIKKKIISISKLGIDIKGYLVKWEDVIDIYIEYYPLDDLGDNDLVIVCSTRMESIGMDDLNYSKEGIVKAIMYYRGLRRPK